MNLRDKIERLRSVIKEMGKVAVAYSGGVDSTLLLKITADVLDNRVLAITAVSPITPSEELDRALKIARDLDIEHMVVETDEMQSQEFRANNQRRCYVCKKIRFLALVNLVEHRGIKWIIDGENHDDLKDFRPGRIASKELGIRSPLRECRLSKVEIRKLSKQLMLPTWNSASQSCLATRIPYHSPITEEKLDQIDSGEKFLRALGFKPQLRLRHHGSIARLEVDPLDIPKALNNSMRQKICSHLQELGFEFITLDLNGYEMGSLNRGITKVSNVSKYCKHYRETPIKTTGYGKFKSPQLFVKFL